MVKTPAEHQRLIQALRITEAAFDATIAAAYEGVTERELQRVFDTAIVAAGARPAFALIRFGRGMALGQVPAVDTRLERGDYIWFDIGCTLRGYRSDIGRVVEARLGIPDALRRDLRHADEMTARVKVRASAPVTGRALRELSLPTETGMWVMAIRSGIEWQFDPGPDDVLSEGDVLLVEVKSLKGGPLRDFSDRIRQQEKADGAIVASRDDGRVFLVVNFDEALVARGLDAVQVVRELGKHIGGGGGGKPTLAEAGGKNPDGIADALAAAKELVAP